MPEIKTILVATVILYVISGLVPFIIDHGKFQTSARYWGLAMLILALGTLFIGLRNIIPDYFSIVIANTLITIGFCFFTFAICEFAETEIPIKTLGVILFHYILFFHLFPEIQFFRLRVIVNSFTSIIIALFSLYFLFQIPNSKRSFARFILIGFFSVAILVFLSRGLIYIFFDTSSNLFDQNAYNKLYFLSAIVIPLVATSGFVLMIRQAEKAKPN